MTGSKGKRLAAVISDETADKQHLLEPKLDRTTQTRLGDQLRAMYDDLVSQPVPDRFKDLLDRLEQGSTPEKAR
jgi:hypothetical protein